MTSSRRLALAALAVLFALTPLGCETVRVRPGHGAPTATDSEPTPLVGDDALAALPPPRVRATAVAAGLFQSCALTDTGAVVCWGQNIDGVVDGSGEAAATLPPTQVAGIEGATALRAARASNCVRQDTDAITCWGLSAIGRGYGGGLSPLTKRFSTASGAITDFAIGQVHACGCDAQGGLHCLGRSLDGQRAHDLGQYAPDGRANRVESLEHVIGVAAGRIHTCALVSSGGVWCFGGNGDGQLGDGRETFRVVTPKQVVGLDDAVEIAAHADGWMTCAKRRGGEVVCWGSRGTPQDDGGLELIGRTPVALPPMPDAAQATALTVGLWQVCMIPEDGRPMCWAESLAHVRGETGAPVFGEPRAIEGLPPVVELALGVAHGCARTAAGHVLCWGSNEYGQLGDGTTAPHDAPLAVALDSTLEGASR